MSTEKSTQICISDKGLAYQPFPWCWSEPGLQYAGGETCHGLPYRENPGSGMGLYFLE